MMAQLMQSQKDTGSVPPDGGTAGILPPQSKMGSSSSSSSARHQMSGKGSNATAQLPQDQTPQKCPRCDSLNTKFCYYNNYSTSQPRHFCKNCRRYWTRGGALRNVPVGGGCRKNKRVKQRLDPAAALAVAQLGGGGAAAAAPPGLMDIAASGHRSVDGVNLISAGHSMMHGLFSPLNVLNMQAPPNSLLSPPPQITASSLFAELAHMKENGIGRFLPAGFPTAPPPFLGSSGVNVMIPSSSGAGGPQSLFAPPLVDRVASPPSSAPTHLLSAAAAYDHMPPFSSSTSSSSLMQPQPPNITSLYSGTSPEVSPFSLYDSHSAAAPPCSGTLVDHLSGFNGSGAGLIRDNQDQVDVDQVNGAQGTGRKNKLMGDESLATAASDDPWHRPTAGMSMPVDHQVSNNFFLQLPSPAAGSLWNWPEMHTALTATSSTTAAGGILH